MTEHKQIFIPCMLFISLHTGTNLQTVSLQETSETVREDRTTNGVAKAHAHN